MRRYATVIVLLFTAALWADEGDAPRPTVPPGAVAAVKRYDTAITAADAVRQKAAGRARDNFLADLKVVRNVAIQKNDLDGAEAIEKMEKDLQPPTLTSPNEQSEYAGKTWKDSNGLKITFVADGTIQSSGDEKGYWHPIGPRSVLVVFSNHTDWVKVYEFDETGKEYKAAGFQMKGDFVTGSLLK